MLSELLNDLSKIDGIEWIRFLYSYPESINDELIKVVKENDKICKYFDLPIQHVSDEVLRRMNRKCTKEEIINLVQKLRKEIPDVILRTTLIVGFPGETEEQFDELCEFIKEYPFNRLGAFAYSIEDGTPAAKFKDQLPKKIKEARRRKIMTMQQGISKELLEQHIGKQYKCLIENVTFDGNYYIGRTYMDVPSEDGVVFIENNQSVMINDFVNIKITKAKEYDLYGKIAN